MKHITLKFSILSLVFISLVLWSCKEELPVKEKEFIEVNNFYSSTFTISNPNNYMDYIGEWHNECIDFIYNYHGVYPASNLTKNEIAYVMDIWFHQKTGIIIQTNSLENELLVMLDSIETYTALSNAQLYNLLNLNTNQILYMNQVFNLCSNILTPTQDTLTYLTDVIDAFNDLENTVLNDNSLDSNQKVIVLITSSVLKHSFYYWNSHINLFYDLPYAKRSFKLLGFWADAWDAVSFVGSRDAGGAVAGAAGGAATTWAINVIPGAGQAAYGASIAGGAAGGAVATSIGYACDRWIFNKKGKK